MSNPRSGINNPSERIGIHASIEPGIHVVKPEIQGHVVKSLNSRIKNLHSGIQIFCIIRKHKADAPKNSC